jgi:hypothetical protein
MTSRVAAGPAIGAGQRIALDRRGAAWGCVLVLLVSWAWPAGAEIVELRMPTGVVATAGLRRGDTDKPAVMILHGFLQTRDFPTVRRLADSLADSGYTVLAPTLSLDIDRRRHSLACEAIHTHTMEKDGAEIRAWLDWLGEQVPSAIVVIGHSSAAVELLAQAAQAPHPRVIGMVLVSPIYFGEGLAGLAGPQDRQRAEAALEEGVAGPQEYSLSFCTTYPTLPQAYLSYVSWNRQRLTQALRSLDGIGVVLILGEGDRRIDRGWIDELVAVGAEVESIEGADHFFDSMDEFEFLDTAESAIEALSRAGAAP